MRKYCKESFSQSGEDMIVDFIFKSHGIECPSYIDIGAHDPFYLSNTAFFYKKGGRGINVEPNPILYSKIASVRTEDINLNLGLGTTQEKLDFYVLNSETMSSFSKNSVEKLCQKYNFSVVDTLEIQVDTLENVINTYWNGKYPDFISLDVEGLELDILMQMDFSKEGAYVICVETLEYSEEFDGEKDRRIISFLKENGYVIYADTYINTILVKEKWL